MHGVAGQAAPLWTLAAASGADHQVGQASRPRASGFGQGIRLGTCPDCVDPLRAASGDISPGASWYSSFSERAFAWGL